MSAVAASAARVPVLYLLDLLRPGVGVPETLRFLIEPVRAAGFELHVGALHREPGDLGDELAARAVPLLDLAASGFASTLRRMARTGLYLRRHRIALIHANEYRAIHLALRLAQFAPRLRVVGHLRVTGNVRSSSGRRERWLARHARRMSELVAVSQAVLDDFRDATGLRDFGRVIWNGRPLVRFERAADPAERERTRRSLGIAEGVPLLICAATLQPSKDHPTLLRAAARLKQEGVAFTLLLAGEGPARGELEALAASLDLAPQVRLLGRRDDVPQLLSCADLYVSASLREGLPGSVIEAQASGLPCVVTRCGGPEEVVVDGESGLVVPPSDPAALSSALATLLRDAPLRSRMAAAARANARRFDLDRTVAAWSEVYRAALSS